MIRKRPPRQEFEGCTYFITVRLLDRKSVDLTDPPLASVLVGALRYFDDERYLLFDYTVMPDHMHFILKPLQVDGRTVALSAILHSLKSYTAHEINKLLNRTGAVWEDGAHDHVIRNRLDFEEKTQYIFLNAVRAELVSDPLEWPWWGRGCGEP